MGKKNNSYTASYKLKMISFAEQFGNRAAQREFGILESNVCYWRKQKEILKIAKVTVGHSVVRKLENQHILRTPIFQRPN
jgi:transposase-like protein